MKRFLVAHEQVASQALQVNAGDSAARGAGLAAAKTNPCLTPAMLVM